MKNRRAFAAIGLLHFRSRPDGMGTDNSDSFGMASTRKYIKPAIRSDPDQKAQHDVRVTISSGYAR